jgi:MFS family permease
MIGNAIGLWILSRSGRRNMTIISMGVTGLLWGAMGVTGFWSSPTLTYVAGGIMIAVIITCGLGCWPAGYAITGETSSLQLRALTQGIGGVAAQGSSITIAAVLPQLFGRDKAALGAKTGFVFCGLCAIGLLLTWLWIPEMKGRSMQEIDYMFAMKLPTRKFKHWKSDTHEMQEVLPLRDN